MLAGTKDIAISLAAKDIPTSNTPVIAVKIITKGARIVSKLDLFIALDTMTKL